MHSPGGAAENAQRSGGPQGAPAWRAPSWKARLSHAAQLAAAAIRRQRQRRGSGAEGLLLLQSL